AQQIVAEPLRKRLVHVCVCFERYVTFGSVPRSSRSFAPRGDRERRDTTLSGSFRSPKTSAFAEHDCTHAGFTSPSSSSRLAAFASISTALMRCTQKVHFSITPTSRTETSGFSCRWSGLGHCGLKKSKNRTLYGHALAQ